MIEPRGRQQDTGKSDRRPERLPGVDEHGSGPILHDPGLVQPSHSRRLRGVGLAPGLVGRRKQRMLQLDQAGRDLGVVGEDGIDRRRQRLAQGGELMSGDVVVGPPLTRFGRGGGRLGPPVGLLPAPGAQALGLRGSGRGGLGDGRRGRRATRPGRRGGGRGRSTVTGNESPMASWATTAASRLAVGSGMLGPAAVGVVAGAGGGEGALGGAHLPLGGVDGVGRRQRGRQLLERVAAVGGDHGPGRGFGDVGSVPGNLAPQLVEQALTGCPPGARPEELDRVLAPGAAGNAERPPTADADPGGDAGLVVEADRPQQRGNGIGTHRAAVGGGRHEDVGQRGRAGRDGRAADVQQRVTGAGMDDEPVGADPRVEQPGRLERGLQAGRIVGSDPRGEVDELVERSPGRRVALGVAEPRGPRASLGLRLDLGQPGFGGREGLGGARPRPGRPRPPPGGRRAGAAPGPRRPPAAPPPPTSFPPDGR